LQGEALTIATADPGRDGDVRYVGSMGGDLASLANAFLRASSLVAKTNPASHGAKGGC
jgi:hypothetical protein